MSYCKDLSVRIVFFMIYKCIFDEHTNLPIDNWTIYFLCHLIFQGYFYILMFVIYLDNISVLFIMSKGRDKSSVIDFWNIEHSPRKWIWKIQYRVGVLHRYRCNCKYRTLLLHFECWFTVQLLKVFFHIQCYTVVMHFE